MKTDRQALEAAVAAIRFWHDRNPKKEIRDEPPEIARQREAMMQVLSGLREGEEDPWLGKPIRKIIRKSTRYIVYLDENCDAQWWWINKPGPEEGLSLIQANISRLQADSAFLGSNHLDLRTGPVLGSRPWRALRSVFMGESAAHFDARVKGRAAEKLESIRSLIAESMAMVVNGASIRDCQAVQAMAEQQILVAKDQACRGFFFRHFAYATVLLGFVAVAVSALNRLYPAWVEPPVVSLFEAALAGAFGAFVSAMTRTRQLGLEPESGTRGLMTEAWSRALIGAGAAVLLSFAFDAQLLLKGALSDESARMYVRLFLCIAAGASERILPNLLGRAEGLVDAGPRAGHVK